MRLRAGPRTLPSASLTLHDVGGHPHDGMLRHIRVGDLVNSAIFQNAERLFDSGDVLWSGIDQQVVTPHFRDVLHSAA